MKWLLALMVVAVYVIHQDYWNWKDSPWWADSFRSDSHITRYMR